MPIACENKRITGERYTNHNGQTIRQSCATDIQSSWMNDTVIAGERHVHRSRADDTAIVDKRYGVMIAGERLPTISVPY